MKYSGVYGVQFGLLGKDRKEAGVVELVVLKEVELMGYEKVQKSKSQKKIETER